MTMIALCIAMMGQQSLVPTFWSLPSAMLTGVAAAGGMAMINAVGNLGGWLGPSVYGLVKDATGSADIGLLCLAVGPLITAIAVVLAGHDRRLERMLPCVRNEISRSNADADRFPKADQQLAFNDGVAGLAGHCGDDAVRGGGKAENRLHRFEHDQDLAARYRHACFGEHLRDLTWDRCDEAAARIVVFGGGGYRIRQAQTEGFAVEPHADGVALARSTETRCAHAIQNN